MGLRQCTPRKRGSACWIAKSSGYLDFLGPFPPIYGYSIDRVLLIQLLGLSRFSGRTFITACLIYGVPLT